jgi:hypothetical protein
VVTERMLKMFRKKAPADSPDALNGHKGLKGLLSRDRQ